MKPLKYALVLTPLMLAACGGTSRPVYSGHEENTKGVPGFTADGKKTSPYVKLGQSYTVDGETYVPRYQPGYTEEGLASWYGPGFHGGKTANGEEFDKGEMTAAHRTLPLPSMVKVTMLDTGKSVIVRINDRGPFAKGRIIDLSRAAAEKIGLVQKGTARVRVEYLGQETQRFTSLLSQGRDPKDIDVDREVLTGAPIAVASNTATASVAAAPQAKSSWLDHLNPISNAQAHEPTTPMDLGTNDSADVMEVTSTDLAAPAAPKPMAVKPAVAARPITAAPVSPMVATPAVVAATAPVATSAPSDSPFSVMDEPEEGAAATAAAEPAAQPVVAATPAPAAVQAPAPAPVASAPAPAVAAPQMTTPVLAAGQKYFQLGAFANEENAQRLISKVGSIGTASVESKTSAATGTLYVVRMGPYSSVEESSRVLAQLNGMGINPQTVVK